MTWNPRRKTVRLALAIGAVTGMTLLACETPAPEKAFDVPVEASRAATDANDGWALRIAAEGDTQAAEGDAMAGTIRLRSIGPGEGQGPLIFIDEEEADEVTLRKLNPDEIDRVEVIKGGAAEALLGERATGGVIKVYRKKP